MLAGSKIDNSNLVDIRFFFQQNIFRLQVSVANIVRMAIGNRGHQLLKYQGSSLLSKMVLFYEKVKQLPSLTELGDDVEVLLVLVKLINAEHVRMVDFFQQVNLINQLILLGFGLLLFVNDFDGYLLSSHIVNGLATFTKGSFY